MVRGRLACLTQRGGRGTGGRGGRLLLTHREEQRLPKYIICPHVSAADGILLTPLLLVLASDGRPLSVLITPQVLCVATPTPLPIIPGIFILMCSCSTLFDLPSPHRPLY
ncbi:unnamed protein product [Pleuronectes platessa]|uniref:Uncharacterized protein n=1 Tax=Pleuronectes platessa TaxID=8262 RepID=A0A9N7YVY1_PLEPL|nr:unnamed protein product [Pleuronectes platessa]